MKARIEKLTVYRREANPPYEVFAPAGMTFEDGCHSRIAWDKAEAKSLAAETMVPCAREDCDVCEENLWRKRK